MSDCEHIHLVRVEGIGTGKVRPPQDDVYTYYCQDCHLTLYVKFTDAPPIVVNYGRPVKSELCDESNCPACGAQCDRKQDHEGQHHCINCGCRWSDDE